MAQARLSRAWDDIQPYYIGGGGPSEAATAQYGTTGFYWVKFPNSGAFDYQKQFGFQIPHRWLAASSAHLHLHVVPSQNGAGGNEDVVIRVEYQWVNIGSKFSSATNTAFNTTFRVGATQGDEECLWEPAELSGVGKTLSSDLSVIISRQSKTEAADNYTGDIWLRFVDLHVVIDKLGSLAEVTD